MHTPPEWAFHLLVWSLAAIGPEPTTEMAATKISLSMKKSDVTCPDCFAGYRRIELEFRKGLPGQYKCVVCDRVLEVFDGSREIAYRLTVQPSHLRPEET
jgi:transposase-like protein